MLLSFLYLNIVDDDLVLQMMIYMQMTLSDLKSMFYIYIYILDLDVLLVYVLYLGDLDDLHLQLSDLKLIQITFTCIYLTFNLCLYFVDDDLDLDDLDLDDDMGSIDSELNDLQQPSHINSRDDQFSNILVMLDK